MRLAPDLLLPIWQGFACHIREESAGASAWMSMLQTTSPVGHNQKHTPERFHSFDCMTYQQQLAITQRCDTMTQYVAELSRTLPGKIWELNFCNSRSESDRKREQFFGTRSYV